MTSHAFAETSRDRASIVVLGDSLAYGQGDEKDGGLAGRLHATNLGKSGAQTTDVIRKLKMKTVRDSVQRADVIVLSIGANDLFRTAGARERAFHDPFALAGEILDRIAAIVASLREINNDARILLLGAYNPVPDHPLAALIDDLVRAWDQMLAARFARDDKIDIVMTSDVVIGANLSRYDRFHPGAPAYDALARRIEKMMSSRG
jgi:lysophospholipase L1-like esterase